MIQRPTGADMPVYAALSTMRQQPTQDEIANGVIPLDTLPANWWNWLWNTITKAQNDLQYNDEVIFTEINNVLAAGGITPNPTADAQATHDQLIRAINVIKNAVATTTTLGVVKSSDTGTDGSVRVNTGGTMTVNGFGDLATLHTVDKSTITGAINEVHDEMDALNNDLTQEIQTEAAEIRGEIGTLSSLTTSAKGSTVAAINELQSEVNTNKTSIGTLSSLTTTNKRSIVAAINELQSEVNTVAGGLQNIGISMPIVIDGVLTTGSGGTAVRKGLYEVITGFVDGATRSAPASMYGRIRNGWLSISRISSETSTGVAIIDLDIAVFATAPIASGDFNAVMFTCVAPNTADTYPALTGIMSRTFRDMDQYYASSDQLSRSCSIKDLWLIDADGNYISMGSVGYANATGSNTNVTYQANTPNGKEIVRAGVLLGITYRIPMVGMP